MWQPNLAWNSFDVPTSCARIPCNVPLVASIAITHQLTAPHLGVACQVGGGSSSEFAHPMLEGRRRAPASRVDASEADSLRRNEDVVFSTWHSSRVIGLSLCKNRRQEINICFSLHCLQRFSDAAVWIGHPSVKTSGIPHAVVLTAIFRNEAKSSSSHQDRESEISEHTKATDQKEYVTVSGESGLH